MEQRASPAINLGLRIWFDSSDDTLTYLPSSTFLQIFCRVWEKGV
uniref:Protein kinase n=1 Tax=Rhizophora mucronata TaxID=61149 RepID=A0A2P2IKY1_RHIMU